ncbi:MAG TPA: ATP-dependent helicase [Clostridiaceae bacterium]
MEALWDCVVIEKKRQNKMDFYDLIMYATKLLETITFSPKWIIIDEFQDCDESQLAFVKALRGNPKVLLSENTKIFAVGDPNQIIYTWRGSINNIFNEFKKEYEAEELTLPVNYRSSGTILEAAKAFLSEKAVLQGTREVGNPITLINQYDSFNEANYLSVKIGDLHKSGIEYKDIAVFYRMQKQSQVIEEVFQKENIPFEVSIRRTLLDIPVLRWFVNLLKATVNEKDTTNLISVLKDKTFGEGMTKAKIRKIVYDKVDESSILFNKIRGFESWSKNQTPPYNLYRYFDLDNYLSPTSVTYVENNGFVLNFLEKIIEYSKFKDYSIVGGIKEFINSSALYGVDILKENIDKSEDSVKLMTLHACKGLEFKYVFIIGVNYGLIPLNTATIEEQEEEKRLFFVGITRAKDNLEISYYTNPENPRVMSDQSSYIYMLPKHLIQSSDIEAQKGDLNAFRREIKSNMENTEKNQTIDKVIKKKVRHSRYGMGYVEWEDESVIVAIFQGYGRKEFTKAFNAIEFLEED